MDICQIPSNPDISGIGVRAAIYVQSLLCFAPAVDAIRDLRVSTRELDRVRNQSTATLIIAFAILISTVIQALTLGLTNYHATIVLSLSWMNNTNAFVFFLLYVQYRSQMDKTGDPAVKPELSAWIDHIRTVWKRNYSNRQFRELERRKTFAERGWNFLTAESIIILGSVHLSFMAGLGIWLWRDPGTFGEGEACAYGIANLGVLGHRVPFNSNALKIFSLSLYALFLIPGVNLIIPAAVFMGPFLFFQNRRYDYLRKHKRKGKETKPIPGMNWKRFWSTLDQLLRYPSVMPICIGLLLLFLINIIFIFDVELVLLWNQPIQKDQGDSEWGFGQTLAILLLVMPLRDLQLIDWILSLWNVKKEAARKGELNEKLKEEIENDNPGGFLKIMELVMRGADPNIQAESKNDKRIKTALEICALTHDFQGVAVLLERGADPNVNFSKQPEVSMSGGSSTPLTPLERVAEPETLLDAAIINKKTDLSFTLLLRGSEAEYADFSIYPLHAAVRMNSEDLVKHLLAAGYNPNERGGHYGTPLMAAIKGGNAEIVKLLLENNAIVDWKSNKQDGDAEQGKQYGTHLAAATRGGNADIIELIKNADRKQKLEPRSKGKKSLRTHTRALLWALKRSRAETPIELAPFSESPSNTLPPSSS